MTKQYGRRPPKRATAIRWGDISTPVQALSYPPVDYLAALSSWQMLGNDVKSDCVAITWANTRRLVTAKLSTEFYPPQAMVDAVYATQNPNGSDNGMDMQTLLEDLHSAPGPDGAQVVAFALVDHTNETEVDEAIDALGSVWTGVNVLQANETQFEAGQPFDDAPGSPDVGGHAVITGGNLPGNGALSGKRQFITWAQETSFTEAYWQARVEECWAVIWPEHLGTRSFEAGVSRASLASAYQQVTGKALVL